MEIMFPLYDNLILSLFVELVLDLGEKMNTQEVNAKHIQNFVLIKDFTTTIFKLNNKY